MRDKLGRFIKGDATGIKTRFIKGQPPTKGSFKKGHIPWDKNKKRPNVSGKNHFHWKGGKFKTTQGYILIKKPNHPFCNNVGYVKRANLVVEKIINRFLKSPELVHHRGKRDDDRPHMLIAFINKSVHSRFHKNPNNVKPEEIIFDGRLLTD